MSIPNLTRAVTDAETSPIQTVGGRCRFVVARERRLALAAAKAANRGKVAKKDGAPKKAKKKPAAGKVEGDE